MSTPAWILRDRRRAALVGAFGLSALAVAALLIAAYFAGTAPRLPATVAALERVDTSGAWPPRVTAHPLDDATPSSAEASPENLRLLPHAPDPAEAPPIDLSDLPPPAHPAP